MGKNRKPFQKNIKKILDIVLFDIQGCRGAFYNYISTMQFGLEDVPKNNIPIIVWIDQIQLVHYGMVLTHGNRGNRGSLGIDQYFHWF